MHLSNIKRHLACLVLFFFFKPPWIILIDIKHYCWLNFNGHTSLKKKLGGISIQSSVLIWKKKMNKKHIHENKDETETFSNGFEPQWCKVCRTFVLKNQLHMALIPNPHCHTAWWMISVTRITFNCLQIKRKLVKGNFLYPMVLEPLIWCRNQSYKIPKEFSVT